MEHEQDIRSMGAAVLSVCVPPRSDVKDNAASEAGNTKQVINARVAQLAQQRTCNAPFPSSSLGLCSILFLPERVWYIGSAPSFQVGDASSILAARSKS